MNERLSTPGGRSIFPIAAEALADVRRVLGANVVMRTVWSGERSTVFQVLNDDQPVAYLKLATGLAGERARLEWLEARLPVPQVLGSGEGETTEWLLTTPLPGLELANLKHTASPSRIVALLAQTLKTIHAMPTDGCPFGESAPGAVVTHGDACLPNFLFVGDRLSGVLDVGAFGLGEVGSELATAVWSIQYNLGSGHAGTFLDAYGIDVSSGEFDLITDAEGKESLRRREASIG